MLAADRPRDINLPVGLSNREGTLAFYEVPAGPGLSTFSSEQAEDHRRAGFELVEHRIPVTTLAHICEQYHVPTIDFLKVDVEGYEREVLEGADWERYRPRVVLIEATKPLATLSTHEHWESILLSADYRFAFFDGMNRYYVRGEDRKLMPLLSVPANYFDDYERYTHLHRVQDLELQLQHLRRSNEETMKSRESVRRELEQTRAVLAGAREELAGAREELAGARQKLAGADAELTATRQELDTTRAGLDQASIALAEMRDRLAGLQAELDTARARLDLFEGWGPMTISVVRRLRLAAARVPLAKSLLRRAILFRRGLRSLAAGHA